MPEHTADNDAGTYYCPTCQHPYGYHHETRGCTMPLDLSGLPVMRTWDTVGPCACRVTPPEETHP
jgi:hypothetical protein